MEHSLASSPSHPPAASTAELERHDTLVYEVEVRDGRAPVLLRLGRANASVAAEGAVGSPCFRALHGRHVACEGCPIGLNTTPAAAFHASAEPGDEERYHKRQIERLGTGRYRIRSRRVQGSAVSALIRARVDRAFTRARLTGRERSVVDCLLLGRSVDDIAKMLGLSPHTVKFHKVNALKKLGADSSLDLLRIFVG